MHAQNAGDAIVVRTTHIDDLKGLEETTEVAINSIVLEEYDSKVRLEQKHQSISIQTRSSKGTTSATKKKLGELVALIAGFVLRYWTALRDLFRSTATPP